VFQEAFLSTDTVMNNLRHARGDATEEDATEAAKQSNARELIMGLPEGYDTMLTERGANLSQGQRQMITIARATVADPKMTIRDSNRIMMLNGGEVEETASHDELMAAKGFYYALYMSQFKGNGPGWLVLQFSHCWQQP
jgi:ABC-type multidrug transport system fused ATPase/permease subunit